MPQASAGLVWPLEHFDLATELETRLGFWVDLDPGSRHSQQLELVEKPVDPRLARLHDAERTELLAAA